MEIKIKSYNSQSSLITSIILFIIGGILYKNPEIFITTISKIIGLIILLISIYNFIIVFTNKNKEYNMSIKITSATLLLIIAILFLFYSETVEKAIRIVVGFWIIFSGINRLINALQSNQKNKISLIIISILLILIGLYTIIIGDVIISTIGIIIMIYSLIDIIGFILYKKDNPVTTEINSETTLITTEETPKKRKKLKKIKDVDVDEK